MDCFKDPSLKLKYQKSKIRVKLWESEFRKEKGTNPSKSDIKEAPEKIREAYKWYWKLKIVSLGESPVLDIAFDDSFLVCNLNDSTRKVLSDIQNESIKVSPSSANSSTPSEAVNNTLRDKAEGAKLKESQECVKSATDTNTPPHNESKETPSSNAKTDDNVNTRTVWGSHLNQPKEEVKKTPLVRSASFHISEKLFVGSKFKKRNPRKSLSFSQNKSLDKSKISPTETLGSMSATPELSAVNLFAYHATDRTPVTSLQAKSKSEASNLQGETFSYKLQHFASNSATVAADNLPSTPFRTPTQPVSDLPAESNSHFERSVKIVKNCTLLSSQPISLIHKVLRDDDATSKPKVERKIDTGWLDRCATSVSTPTGEFSDSGIDVNEANITSTPKCPPKTVASPDARTLRAKSVSQPAPSTSAAIEDSDDDFIYDSDEEPKTSLLSRSMSAMLLPAPSIPSINPPVPSIPTVNPPVVKETHKRKLDAIEAAMAVLAARTDQARNTAKKARRESDEDSSDYEGDNKSSKKKKAGKSNLVKKKSAGKMTKEDLMEKKLSSGTANENYVRVNLKKKVFVRGKKSMNFQKYKKQQWKNKKKELANSDPIYKNDPSDNMAGGGIQTCFKCGEVGHFARACLKMRGDDLLPLEDDEEESPFPTLAEVEEMAKQASGSAHAHMKARQAHEAANVAACTLTSQPTYEALPLVISTESKEAPADVASLEGVDANDFEMDDDDMLEILKEPAHVRELMRGSVQPIYHLNSDGSLIDTPPEVYEALRMFGHKSFRPGQEKAIMRILSGLSTLVTLSTGSGKSLCYQLPAYLYSCRSQSVTLVVSPLVSLMDDQVSGLPAFVKAAALHTNQTPKQREKVKDMVKSGKLQFLLVSPEAVVSGEGRSGFGSILRDLPEIAFACVDEAHCVSQWSHNFRPSYLMICKVLREKLGVRTILGLTATATRATAESIIEHLNIPDGWRGIIQDIPLPDNLTLSVSKDSRRDAALIQLLNSEKFEKFESIIVYCTRREECERLAAMIRACLKNGEPQTKKKLSANAEAYHAGMSATKRKQVQTAFMTGNIRIVVATVAFGMGINKQNIRAVIHYNMPSSFESYVQEVGRAGRDGLPAHCHLFLEKDGKDLNELKRHIHADAADRHTIRKLLQRVFVCCKCVKSKAEEKDDIESKPAQDGASVEDRTSASEECCPGHEVAFSVTETVAALDIPEENITTLLCYLELHPKKFLSLLPPAYTVCKVQSYKGMRHVRTMAKKCPPLAMAIALDIQRGVNHNKMLSLEFPIVETATAIGWDSGICKKELKNMEWTTVNNAPKRSGLKVEFSELGFRVRAKGDMSPEEQDEALDSLFNRVDGQEKASLKQLQGIFRALTEVAFTDIRAMNDPDEQMDRSNALKNVVRQYFNDPDFKLGDYKPAECLENHEQIAADIRQLIATYRDCSFTGRAVARIFHGIQSPNFPAVVWGKCRFWRSHLNSDFKLISLLATRILLQMR